MDLQRLRFAPNTYFVIAISATALMFAFCISSAVLNGDWHILEDSLSSLGISENPVAAFLFNFGCVLTGLLGVVAASGIVQYSSAMMKTAGVTIMLGMLSTVFIGIVTLDNKDAHYLVVMIMVLFFILSALASVYYNITEGRNKTAIVSIIAYIAPMVVYLVCLKLPVYQFFALLGFEVCTLIYVYNIRFESSAEGQR